MHISDKNLFGGNILQMSDLLNIRAQCYQQLIATCTSHYRFKFVVINIFFLSALPYTAQGSTLNVKNLNISNGRIYTHSYSNESERAD